MKKLSILLALFFSITTNAQTGLLFNWAKALTNDRVLGGAVLGQGIKLDASGNTYVAGYFYNTADFDPGTGTANLTSAGGNDIFLAKYDASGNFVFAKSMGGTNNDYSKSIAIDGTGNVYLTGYFSGTADFDPSASTQNITSAANEDIFLAKYDASGNYIFAKTIGGGLNDQGISIILDGSANVYITGSFEGTADFDPGAGIQNLISAGSQDIFFAKYDLSGNYVYANRIGGTSVDAGSSISVDGSGNVFITGFFQFTADFDPGAGTVNLTSAGLHDIFLAKYDVSGNYVYALKMGGTSSDISNSIAIDGTGNAYITGYFNSTADFDPGAGTANLTSAGQFDIFFAKYDASGNYVYAKGIGGTTSDVGNSIAVDGSGNVYLTGYYSSSTVDFDPGAGIQNLTSNGSQNIFFASYDVSGNFIFAKSIGSFDTDAGIFITIDASGNTYITGNFQGTVDFDPAAGTANLVSGTNGSFDLTNAFAGKYNSTGNYVWAIALGRHSDSDNSGFSITRDASGNLYITGDFQGTVDFDPGAGTQNLTSTGYFDIFFAKYDASGNYVYAKRLGGTDDEHGKFIAIDGSGNASITGYFTGTVDFDPGAGTQNLTSTSAFSSDIFFAKYDASGNYVYAKKMGGGHLCRVTQLS